MKIGDKIAFLTLIDRKRILGKNSRTFFLCRCVCGNEKWIDSCQFYAERPTKSCGCKRIELLRAAQLTHGCSVKADTPEYRTFICWQSMIWRCTNPNRADYPRYGGRGIKVCKRWERFENFLADMGLKPRDDLTLGRKNNDGNYTPKNCEWQTTQAQANNKRTNHFLRFEGSRFTLSEWADFTGIGKSTLRQRIVKGWSVRKTLTTPARPMAIPC